MASGTFARFYGISTRAMYDEAASWNIAKLPWRSFLQALWDFEANMGLYYLILRPWLHLGNSEVVVRGLSVVFGVATIPVLYLLGSRLFSQRVGLMATALLAVHAFHIRWSQEARSYALLVLLLTWSTLLLVSALQAERARGRWAGYIVLSALACYCHLFAVFVIAAQWLWIILEEVPRLRRRIPGLSCQIVLIAPAGLYAAFRNQGQLDWIAPLSGRNILELCRAWVGSAAGGYGMALLFCFYSILCVLGVGTGLGSGPRSRRFNTALPVLWVVVPSGAIILGSIVKPMLVDRYLLPCLPALLLLVSLGDRLFVVAGQGCNVGGGDGGNGRLGAECPWLGSAPSGSKTGNRTQWPKSDEPIRVISPGAGRCRDLFQRRAAPVFQVLRGAGRGETNAQDRDPGLSWSDNGCANLSVTGRDPGGCCSFPTRLADLESVCY